MTFLKDQQLAFKKRLMLHCEQVLINRITLAKQAIDSAQQSANAEEKSSAGDKYETSRAMSHLEKDMHARQMAAHLKDLSLLHAISIETQYTQVQPGAYIECKEEGFFLACGLGKQQFEDKTIFFIAPSAPLGSLLMHKKAGDFFVFNGKEKLIDVVI